MFLNELFQNSKENFLYTSRQ